MAISKDFIVKNGIRVDSTSNVNGSATFANSVIVTGNVTFSNSVVVTGNATFANSVAINGLVNITGNINTSGQTNTTTMYITTSANVGTAFTANSTLVNAVALNVVGRTNTDTLYVTTSANVGTAFTTNNTLTNTAALNVVNQTNTATFYATTSANVGTAFTANSTLVNAIALNVVNQTNTATFYATTSANVGTAFTANSSLTNAIALNVVNQTNTGTLYVTTSANVGTAFTANSTLVNAIALNVVNQTNTATFYATTSANVGTAFTANSTMVNAIALNVVGSANIGGSLNVVGVVTGGAAGSNTQVQFNDSGNFGGSTNFEFNKTTNTVSVGTTTINTSAFKVGLSILTSSSLTVGANLTVNSSTMQTDSTVLIGKPTADSGVADGVEMRGTSAPGTAYLTRTNATICTMTLNGTTPAAYIRFRRGATEIGDIGTTDNTTVDYNSFFGTHWACLVDRSKPDILLGTIMETVDQLVKWKFAVFNKNEKEIRMRYNGPEGPGTTVDVEYEGIQYTAVLEYEEPVTALNKAVCVKINDTPATKAVFGVFAYWDSDDQENENIVGTWTDMKVGSVGNYFIRIAANQIVNIGDLIEADGTGCGRVQDDDIIRTKTVGKVTSTIKQRIYDDDSYLVSAVLYCG